MIQKKQLIAAFDGITDLILIIDPDYNIVFANSAFCDFYEVNDLRKIIGRKCYSTCRGLMERCDICPAMGTLESGETVTVEKELRGEILKYWTYPVYDENNTVVSIVSCARIITGQKRMEQELVRSEKLKGIGQLAAGVAHEINNPLCSIIGYTQLIQESLPKSDPNHAFLIDVLESAVQAKRIVDGLLEYSRQSVYSTRLCGIGNVIKKTLELVKYQLSAKKISVSCEIADGLPRVKIDIQKTIQAFLNILLNALEASPEGGTVFIDARRNGDDCLIVRLRDEGCGISSDDISNIFNPFFTTKDVGKGTGLGLSIAQGIFEHQNAKIKVESELGKGTCFEVQLPVEKQSAGDQK
ncbi:MAG: PAS domain-containing protein [Candidatus Glassbacteria bacterium]|nr:PAS domain-containing protein [Candidatus Glassbacteria bacterium]